MTNLFGHRQHPFYLAFIIHRLSGVGLAVFLPAHFLVLGLAIEESAALDGFLSWTDQPLVKAAETLLIILLSVHFAGGLRLLMIEFVTWNDRQKLIISSGFAASLGVGLLFLLNG
jgi:succinate dehydrogenase subunit D